MSGLLTQPDTTSAAMSSTSTSTTTVSKSTTPSSPTSASQSTPKRPQTRCRRDIRIIYTHHDREPERPLGNDADQYENVQEPFYGCRCDRGIHQKLATLCGAMAFGMVTRPSNYARPSRSLAPGTTKPQRPTHRIVAYITVKAMCPCCRIPAPTPSIATAFSGSVPTAVSSPMPTAPVPVGR